MPSPVESAIRGVVTKGVVAIADFNRERKKAKGLICYRRRIG